MTGELSRKEQALWFFQQDTPEIGVLNVPFAIRASGRLMWWPLDQALRHLRRRHPALRTIFPAVDGLPSRRVLDPDDPRVARNCLEVRVSAAERLADDLTRFAAEPIDVTVGLPLRAALFQVADGDVACIVVSHLVFDMHSAFVVHRELISLYAALAATRSVPAALAGQIDSVPQRSPDPDSVRYWERRLVGLRDLDRTLAIGRTGPRDPSFPGNWHTLRLSGAAQDAVQALTAGLSASRNILMLAVFALLLAQHGMGEDVVVGVPVSVRGGRPHDAVGCHVSFIAVRMAVTGTQKFSDFVRQVREDFLTDLLHADVSVEDLSAAAYDDATSIGRPIFRHMFNFALDAPFDDGPAGAFTMEQFAPAHSRLDLDFGVTSQGAGIVIRAGYGTDIFLASEVEALVARYERLLLSAAAGPDASLSQLSCHTAADDQVVSSSATVADPAGRPLPPGVRGEIWHQGSATGQRAVLRPDGQLALLADLDLAAPSGTARAGTARAGTAQAGTAQAGTAQAGTAQAGARTSPELVAELVAQWRSVLRRPDADDETHFFACGGNSLLAARLVAGIKRSRGVKVSMRTVFRHPTPSQLAAEISRLGH